MDLGFASTLDIEIRI